MDQKLYRALFLLIVLVFFGRIFIYRFFDKSVHKTRIYSVSVPEGWEKSKREDEIVFTSPAIDEDTGIPEAMFGIYAKRSSGALFLEDILIEVLDALKKENGEIIDKGEVKISEAIAKWVLFHYKEPDLLILSFYIADEFNQLIRIQYIAVRTKFRHYQPVFEAFKESIKIKGIF